MKHIKIFAMAIALVMAFAACSCRANPATEGVLTPESDEQLRPGMKPDQVTVIDFNATWCGPCQVFSPIFHKAAENLGNVKFYSVDTDEYPATASAFGIEAIPTIMIISPDGQTQTIVGLGRELTEGCTEDTTEAEDQEIIYNNFCKLITKAAGK